MFTAYVRGEIIDARATLEALLAVLDEITDIDSDEDVAVWQGHRLAAVVRGRAVTVFDLTPEPTPPASVA